MRTLIPRQTLGFLSVLCLASGAGCGDSRDDEDAISTGFGDGTEGGSEQDSEDTGPERYDVGEDGGQGTAGDGGEACDCGEAGLEFSYIWVSNTPQGTVSKIDTQTMVEAGRYRTTPVGNGDPSRTSVNISGRAAAVANRYGGITKFHARPEDCEDTNGTPGIQTSTGPNDVRTWDQEECVAWHTEFPEFTTQRPVAWTAGELDDISCTYRNEKIWTAGCGGGAWPGQGGGNVGFEVHLLDGDTGAREEEVSVETSTCGSVGPYGGAVDAEGNFWFNKVGDGPASLGVVRRDDMSYQHWGVPKDVYTYGMTVDSKGRPWVSSIKDDGAVVARFDPETETWEVSNDPGFESEGGMQQDELGRIWVGLRGSNPGVAAYDAETMQRVDYVDLGEKIKGVSIDADGFVWAVSHRSAYRVDPFNHDVQSYDDLDDPYTYSDMTGWGLFHSSCPTPEG